MYVAIVADGDNVIFNLDEFNYARALDGPEQAELQWQYQSRVVMRDGTRIDLFTDFEKVMRLLNDAQLLQSGVTHE